MKVEQNTEEWHEWRKKGIGASEAPIVLGVSPWKTAYQLWEEKLGLVKRQGENYATQKGHDFEEVARQHFEIEYEKSMKPALVEAESVGFIRASLDGISEDGKEILEIKNPGKDAHQLAIDGKVPAYYYPQIQHQLFASGAQLCYYWSFKDDKGVCVKVERDEEYIKDLVNHLSQFWYLVQNGIPPEITDQDWVTQDDSKIETLLQHFDHAKQLEKECQDTMKECKKKIAELMNHRRIICKGRKVSWVARSGSVEYKKIPQLKGVNLDLYRKDPSSYILIK